MSVFKRGRVYWFEFEFNGSRIRESAKTTSKTLAREAERQRRRELERGINRLSQPKKMPLFRVAAQEWLASKGTMTRHTDLHYRQYAKSLAEHFGDRLICDIGLEEISTLQHERLDTGLGHRRVNAEVQVLRQILKYFGRWAELQGRVRFFREPKDTGRAISLEDEVRLLEAAARSRSAVLLPRVILSLDTGIRANEMRQLRHRDLTLNWKEGAIEGGWLTVSHSKTESGSGRTIPLSKRVCAVLSVWLARMPSAPPEGFLFPRHMIGFAGDKRGPKLYEVDFTRPGAEWKSAWRAALRAAGIRYRWHDLRHTFVSRLAENPTVSEQTIMALAGHVSKSMLARYSHIRRVAKQAAIEALESMRAEIEPDLDVGSGSPQMSPQWPSDPSDHDAVSSEKCLN
jgi:integrase